MKKISIMVPCYNEEENVVPLSEALIAMFEKDLPQYDYEILFIDNDSRDTTRVKLRALCENNKKIKAIFNAKNFGQFNSPYYGILQTEGDCTIPVCADFQDPIDVIPRLVAEWEKGYKSGAGVRSGRDEKGIYATCASAFHNFIKKHLNPNYPEGGSDFFLMDRSVVSEYLKIDVQYTGGLLIRYWMGYEQKEIPYVRKKREVGKSGFGFLRKIGIAMELIVSNSIILLRKLLALAVIFVIAGGVLSIILAIRGQALGLILSFMLLMTGILLIGNCILGEYLWRNYELSKGRPRYLLDEVIDEMPKNVEGI